MPKKQINVKGYKRKVKGKIQTVKSHKRKIDGRCYPCSIERFEKIPYEQQIQLAREINEAPPEESRWFNFANYFYIGVEDLDNIAKAVGYDNFTEMDKEVVPLDVWNKESNFQWIVQQNSKAAEHMNMFEIVFGIKESK